jgi:Bacterial protein of unknown function (DUF924)
LPSGSQAQAPPELRRILEHSAAQARGHRDVIARFGRHPHRNPLLGRPSTPEELEYLTSGQLVHTRPLPEQVSRLANQKTGIDVLAEV